MRSIGPTSQAHRTPSMRPPRSLHRDKQAVTHASAPDRDQAIAFIDLLIVSLMSLAIAAILLLPAAMLTNWNIHYLTAGGHFFEKLHPATYLIFCAFALLLVRNGNPVGMLSGMLADAKLIIVYLLCWLLLLIQTLVLGRPFTVVVDTFLLPAVLCLVIWQLTPQQRKPMILAVHIAILLNVCAGYYEYFSGHRIIPLTLGKVLVVGEWRASAFLGHPLTASGLVGGYVLALLLRPAIFPSPLIRISAIAFCLCSLTIFGGRTALVTVLFMVGILAMREMFLFLRGKSISLPMAMSAICLLFIAIAATFTALDLGLFDKMLLRFSSDKGSALARVATFNLLSHFSWQELLIGPNPSYVNALQSQLGLNYGIENFWISCIVQFGIIHTALLTIGLIGLIFEVLRRSDPAAWAIILLITLIAASSVSFSSKNIQLAQFIIIITLLLPRGAALMASHLRSSLERSHIKAAFR